MRVGVGMGGGGRGVGVEVTASVRSFGVSTSRGTDEFAEEQ